MSEHQTVVLSPSISQQSVNLIVEDGTQYPDKSDIQTVISSDFRDKMGEPLDPKRLKETQARKLPIEIRSLHELVEDDSLDKILLDDKKLRTHEIVIARSSSKQGQEQHCEADNNKDTATVLDSMDKCIKEKLKPYSDHFQPLFQPKSANIGGIKFILKAALADLRVRLNNKILAKFIGEKANFKSFNNLLKNLFESQYDMRLTSTSISGCVNFIASDARQELLIAVLRTTDYIKFKEVCAYIIVENLSKDVLQAFRAQPMLLSGYESMKASFTDLIVEKEQQVNAVWEEPDSLDFKEGPDNDTTKDPATIINNLIIHAEFVKRTYKTDMTDLDPSLTIEENTKLLFKRRFFMEIVALVNDCLAETEVVIYCDGVPLITARSKSRDVGAITIAIYTEMLYMVVKNNGIRQALSTSDSKLCISQPRGPRPERDQLDTGSSTLKGRELFPPKKTINTIMNGPANPKVLNQVPARNMPKIKQTTDAVNKFCVIQSNSRPQAQTVNTNSSSSNPKKNNSNVVTHIQRVLRGKKLKKLMVDYEAYRRAYNFNNMDDILYFLEFSELHVLKSLTIKDFIKCAEDLEVSRVLVYLLQDMTRLIVSSILSKQLIESYTKADGKKGKDGTLRLVLKRFGSEPEMIVIAEPNEDVRDLLRCLHVVRMAFPDCLALSDAIEHLKKVAAAELVKKKTQKPADPVVVTGSISQEERAVDEITIIDSVESKPSIDKDGIQPASNNQVNKPRGIMIEVCDSVSNLL